MELKNVFYLSGEELRTIVHKHIAEHQEFKSVLSYAKKDSAGIAEFRIDICSTWEEGNIIQKEGAVLLATDYFVEIEYPVMPLRAKILVYVAEPNKCISCQDIMYNDVNYFYEEQRTAMETAYLSEKEEQPFARWTPFNTETLPAPQMLHTARSGENEWMVLKSVAEPGKLPPKCINYYIFYVNPQTLGK